MKIGILGSGREGGWWKRFFESHGHEVIVSDCAETNLSVINGAEVIIIAVPMSAIASASSQVVTHASAGKLIISVCGLMTPVENMFSLAMPEVAFFHRMIGPQVPNMEGHSMIVNKLRLRKWEGFVDQVIVDTKASVVESTSSDHDRMEGLTQGLVRIIMLAFGHVISEAPLSVTQFKNAPFQGLVAVLARILDFGHLLSRDMVFENPHVSDWIRLLGDAMIEVKGNPEMFEETFAKLSAFLGPEAIKSGSLTIAQLA